MNIARIEKRRRILLGLAVTAGLLFLLSLFGHPGNPQFQLTERSGQKVFPRFERQLSSARIIRVKLADISYTLKRTSPDSPGWVMIESGDYPVRFDRLVTLAQGLSNLTWGDARTKDPDKLDRIGLGAPEDGGSGAYLEVIDDDGNTIASLITGRREDRFYARFPDETKSFRVEGSLPPLYTREAWLDFDIVDTQPDAVAAVRITQANGLSLYLTRPPGTGARAFRPAPPFERDQLISRLATSGPALALSQFAPIDVKPEASLETSRVGRHITSTHDGLEVDISAYKEPDGHYVTLRAVEAGEGAARAATINQRAEGWAFKLTEFDWNDFTPAVRSIVRRPPPVTEEPLPEAAVPAPAPGNPY